MKLVSGQGEWEDQQAQRLPGSPLWSPESQGGASWVASAAGVPLPECTCGVPCWWRCQAAKDTPASLRADKEELEFDRSGSAFRSAACGGSGAQAAPSQAGMLRSTFSLTVEGPSDQRAAKIPHKEVLALEKNKAWRRRASPTRNLGNHRVPGKNGPS